MEINIDMRHGEEEMYSYKSTERSMQDRSIRRLQWAVSCCLLGLCILTALSVYQMVGGYLWHKEEKISSAKMSELKHTTSGGKTFYLAEEPKAHLTGTKQDSNSKVDTLKWEDSRGLAFTKHGMTYNNRSLHIPKTGYYFLYSQVSFRADGLRKLEYVKQTILKTSANYPVPESLLTGTRSLKDSDEYQTIYLGGLFYLRAREMLKVNVSHIQLVDVRVDDRTFFGAYLV
ncbi:tumor necrosis factor ligand superfamily member 15 [Spea bombifrons]|uniref:tumor necrosis factor ligand superfamily member 15 n=1 Tax=Spea bombifrons TaxID=233779 RepID=UPI00234B5FF2|nr:tumor necrosis factor ligand superfamily member 15 [Spea bombifrons]